MNDHAADSVTGVAAIDARGDCGVAMKIAGGPTGAAFIGCSEYPKPQKAISWKDL